MKKLVFIMPLMAISLLASCNNGGSNSKQWYLDSDYINSLTYEDIGTVNKVKVNGLDHKVRLIDVDKDTDKDNKKIHTTWEFVNLLSDNSGYSLATQWNDATDESIASYNYLDSSIRKALTGEGGGHILWAQKGATKWSTTYKKSVLEMLPSDLVNVLVAPKKRATCFEYNTWVEKDIINANGDFDKLFLLSTEEMWDVSPGDERAYFYYSGRKASKIGELRIKKQINATEQSIDAPEIAYTSESGQLYHDVIVNIAGFNYSSDKSGGGYYLLRNVVPSDDRVKGVIFNGEYGGFAPSSCAFAVAPAFCI
ncbi:MAG: hypothetical protein MJ214_02850 [Bacilli bacterium]|nr:hypothetical protein [Bacilli bacterium]